MASASVARRSGSMALPRLCHRRRAREWLLLLRPPGTHGPRPTRSKAGAALARSSWPKLSGPALSRRCSTRRQRCTPRSVPRSNQTPSGGFSFRNRVLVHKIELLYGASLLPTRAGIYACRTARCRRYLSCTHISVSLHVSDCRLYSSCSLPADGRGATGPTYPSCRQWV